MWFFFHVLFFMVGYIQTLRTDTQRVCVCACVRVCVCACVRVSVRSCEWERPCILYDVCITILHTHTHTQTLSLTHTHTHTHTGKYSDLELPDGPDEGPAEEEGA